VTKCSHRSRFITSVSHLREAEQRLKTCENYTFCRESYGQRFWHQSKASVCSTTTRVRTPPLWQQEHWRKCSGRYCHTPPIVLTWHQTIFTCSLHSERPSYHREWFRADDEIRLFLQRWQDEQPQSFFERGIMKLSLRWGRYMEVRGRYVEKRVVLFGKKKKNCYYVSYKVSPVYIWICRLFSKSVVRVESRFCS
jgi:hypothetical protein